MLALRLARAERHDVGADERVQLMAQVDALFAAHQDLVYAICLRMVGDPERAMDLAQDSLFTAYRRLTGFRGEGSFRAWLVQIARYSCLNAIRKRGELLSEDGVLEVSDPASSVLTRLRRHEREELLRQAAAAALDDTEQEVVYLRYTEGLPLARITELLELPGASGARGVLQRCRRKLGVEVRRRLAELGHGSSFVKGTLE